MSGWISHVKNYRTANPQLSYKEAMQASKESYVKTAKPKVVKMRGGCHTDSDGEMVPCKKMKGKGYMKPIRGGGPGFGTFIKALSAHTGVSYGASEKAKIKEYILGRMTGSGKKTDNFAKAILGIDGELPAPGEPGNQSFWQDAAWAFKKTLSRGAAGVKKLAPLVAAIGAVTLQPEVVAAAGAAGTIASAVDAAVS
jgi:hypothetical protein